MIRDKNPAWLNERANQTSSKLKLLCAAKGASSAHMFHDDAFNYSEVDNYKTRRTLTLMPIKDFLSLAAPGFDQTKATNCLEITKSGTSFDSLIQLTFSHNGEGIAQVVGHEGRHRCHVLKAAGFTVVPVVLVSVGNGVGSEIRMDMQDHACFDNISNQGQILPAKLISEDGTHTLAMPTSITHNLPKKRSRTSEPTL
ncbi:hypothetical protein AB4254_08600 [Vibrio breoganii]